MRNAVMAFALLVPSAALAGWPADVDWEPLTLDDEPMEDEAFDASGPDRLDLVGDEDNPVGFWYVDDDYFYLRMRVSDTPLDEAGPYPLHGDAWGFLIDTDDADDTYGYALVLAGYGAGRRGHPQSPHH